MWAEWIRGLGFCPGLSGLCGAGIRRDGGGFRSSRYCPRNLCSFLSSLYPTPTCPSSFPSCHQFILSLAPHPSQSPSPPSPRQPPPNPLPKSPPQTQNQYQLPHPLPLPLSPPSSFPHILHYNPHNIQLDQVYPVLLCLYISYLLTRIRCFVGGMGLGNSRSGIFLPLNDTLMLISLSGKRNASILATTYTP